MDQDSVPFTNFQNSQSPERKNEQQFAEEKKQQEEILPQREQDVVSEKRQRMSSQHFGSTVRESTEQLQTKLALP